LAHETKLSSPSQESPEPGGFLYILLSAFAFFSGWLLCKSGSPQNRGESVSPQNATKEQRNRRNIEPAIVAQIAPTLVNQEYPNRRKEDTPRWKKWAEIAAVLIAFGLLVVNIFQMRATQKASETAANTLRLTFRPRININRLVRQDTLNNGTQLALSFEGFNYGPIAAKNIKVYRYENISSFTDVSRKPYGEPLRDYPKIVGPNAPFSGGIYGEKNLSPQDVNSLTRTDTLPIGRTRTVATFSVLIEYEGDLPGIHHTEACIVFTLPSSRWWTYCPWSMRVD
jgi:hypothetical protein